MADIVITTSAVAQDLAGGIETLIAGAAIVAGKSCYMDTADSNKAKLTNTTTAALATFFGVALNDAAIGQPVRLQTRGNLTMNAVLAAGKGYWLSGTGGSHAGGAAGGICLEADLTATEFGTLLGVAISTTVLKLAPVISSAAR